MILLKKLIIILNTVMLLNVNICPLQYCDKENTIFSSSLDFKRLCAFVMRSTHWLHKQLTSVTLLFFVLHYLALVKWNQQNAHENRFVSSSSSRVESRVDILSILKFFYITSSTVRSVVTKVSRLVVYVRVVCTERQADSLANRTGRYPCLHSQK